ncbi:MAG: sensor protein, partial [Pseudonocardiales bacterium]|nr:sensor protein [Pseudonocardiales bacterium]
RFGRADPLDAERGIGFRTLLCVNDGKSDVESIARLVRHRVQWRLIVADHSALGLAMSIRPDLVMLDLDLPHNEAIEILRQVRGDVCTKRATVAIVGAGASPDEMQHLRAAGADTYLARPLVVREVLELLDRNDGHSLVLPLVKVGRGAAMPRPIRHPVPLIS